MILIIEQNSQISTKGHSFFLNYIPYKEEKEAFLYGPVRIKGKSHCLLSNTTNVDHERFSRKILSPLPL